jgi:hypothetical protein
MSFDQDLVVLHALFGKVEMGGEVGEGLLMLRHLLDHLGQVLDALAVGLDTLFLVVVA